MESVETNQGTDDSFEVASLVCDTPGTPHDSNVEQGDEVDIPSSLQNSAPSTQRVINEIKAMDNGQHPICHFSVFDKDNQHALFMVDK